MSDEKTAAATAAHHARITGREGKRLGGLAAAAKAQGRKRKGLNSADEAAIVLMLRDGRDWRDVERRFGPLVEAEVLAGWRKELERRAVDGDRPRLPSDDRPREA